MQRQDDEGDRPIPWRSCFVYRERRRRVGVSSSRWGGEGASTREREEPNTGTSSSGAANQDARSDAGGRRWGGDAERTSPIEPLCGLFIVGEEANAEEGAGRRAVGDVHTGQRTQRHVSESEPPKSMKNKTK